VLKVLLDIHHWVKKPRLLSFLSGMLPRVLCLLSSPSSSTTTATATTTSTKPKDNVLNEVFQTIVERLTARGKRIRRVLVLLFLHVRWYTDVVSISQSGFRVILAKKGIASLPKQFTKQGAKVLLLAFATNEWDSCDDLKYIDWIECVAFDGRKVLDNYFRVLAHHKFQDKNDPDRFITFIEKFSNHFYHCAQAGCADGDAFWAMLWNFQDHLLLVHDIQLIVLNSQHQHNLLIDKTNLKDLLFLD
jgi:hypothetical protein